MNPLNDQVNYLCQTILGLKATLVEAQKENQSLQKLLLSFYVKDAAKETNLYKINRTGAKINESFQKKKQELTLKIQELEERLSDYEKENVNLNFQVKELKAFVLEKDNLLELYNVKDNKEEKHILSSFKEKELLQIIKNVLNCMKDGRVSREFRRCLKKLEQRNNKYCRSIKSEKSDVEVSDEDIEIMSSVIETRLMEDDSSNIFEKNVTSLSPQVLHENAEISKNDEFFKSVDTEINSSLANLNDYIQVDQSIFSPSSIADSDYSSNGIKSVESLHSEKVTESSRITGLPPTALLVPEIQISVPERIPITNESVNSIQSDASESDCEELVECVECPFLSQDALNSVIDSLLDEMNHISYPSRIVESFRKFCHDDDVLCDNIPKNIHQKVIHSVLDVEESQSNEMVFSVDSNQSMNNESVLGKRKIDELDQTNCKKSKIDQNMAELQTEIMTNIRDQMETIDTECFSNKNSAVTISDLSDGNIGKMYEIRKENNEIVTNTTVSEHGDCENSLKHFSTKITINTHDTMEAINIECSSNVDLAGTISALSNGGTENKSKIENENCKNVATATISENKNDENFPEASLLNSSNEETSDSVTINFESSHKMTDADDMRDLTASKLEVSTKNVNVLSGKSESETCIGGLETKFEKCLTESIWPVSQGTLRSVFDVESRTTDFENTCILEAVTTLTGEISAANSYNTFADFKTKSTNDVNISGEGCLNCSFNSDSSDNTSEKRSGRTSFLFVDLFGADEGTTDIDVASPEKILSTNEVVVSVDQFCKNEPVASSVLPTSISVKETSATDASKEIIADFPTSETCEELSNNCDLEISEDFISSCKGEMYQTPNHRRFGAHSIVKEFAVLVEKIQEIKAFKEFLVKEGLLDHQQLESIDDVCDQAEFFVVAEILGDQDDKFPNDENENTFDDDCRLHGDVISSLHEIDIKTLEVYSTDLDLYNFDVNHSSHQELVMLSKSPTWETNDTSDDETLVIDESKCIDLPARNDEPLVLDTTAKKYAILRDDKINIACLSENSRQKAVPYSTKVHNSSPKKDQPIREITNVPRYNFRRHPAIGSPVSNSVSRQLMNASPTENSEFTCPNQKFDAFAPKAAELDDSQSDNQVQMKFYVENDRSCLERSLMPSCASCFDEIWDKMKVAFVGNSNEAVTNANEELIPCPSSICTLIYERKKRLKGATAPIPRERVLNVSSVKESLMEFLKSKAVDQEMAFKSLSETIRSTNKTTLCLAMTQCLDDCLSSNVRIQDNNLRKCVFLSMRIEHRVFQNFIETLKNHLKKQMFSKEWKVNKNIKGYLVSSLRMLSKFYSRLCKWSHDAQATVSLLRESLFSFKFRGHPIAHSVFEEWPEIFPEDPDERTAVIHIILFTLVHHKMDYNEDLYKYYEVQQKIGTLYGVKLGEKTAEEYAKELMLKLNDDTWNDAITLLCKRQMFHWTYRNVIMKYLMPIVNKWQSEVFSEQILNKALRALRILLASCPVRDEENETYSLDTIVNALRSVLLSDKGSRDSKESVILILGDLCSIPSLRCAETVFAWKPNDEFISANTLEQLKNRLSRKPAIKAKLSRYSNTTRNKTGGHPSYSKRRFERSRLSGDGTSLIAVGVPNKFKVDKNVASKPKSKKNKGKKKKKFSKRNSQ